MEKFYVVGIASGGALPKERRVYGDALVYASDKYEALSRARASGWVPNPGGIWLLGTETQRKLTDIVPEDIDEATKAEAMEKGLVVLWTGP